MGSPDTRYKNIKVSNNTYDELSKLGNLQDSFDSVIRGLLEMTKVKQQELVAVK